MKNYYKLRNIDSPADLGILEIPSKEVKESNRFPLFILPLSKKIGPNFKS